MPIESVITARRNGPLIEAAASLWIKPDDLVVDVTYGLGRFWTHYKPERFVAHDLDPEKGDGVDFRNLPEQTASVDVIVFDPPYVSVGGRDTSTTKDMLGRYGLVSAPKTPAGIDELIAEGLKECARVLSPGGRLFLKSCDYISSGKYHAGHLRALNNALFSGYFVILDEFIHHSGTGPQPSTNLDGTPRRQVHSRRSHSFLNIFGRTKEKVV
jgi:hypothetical protein